MGNSIEQHRSAIGSFNARKKNLRLRGFQGFRTCGTCGSYYTCGSQSFFPGESLFFSCSSFSRGASRCCRNGLHDVFRFSCTRVFLSSIAFIDHLFKTRLALSWKYHCTSYSILLPSTRWIEISTVKWTSLETFQEPGVDLAAAPSSWPVDSHDGKEEGGEKTAYFQTFWITECQ